MTRHRRPSSPIHPTLDTLPHSTPHSAHPPHSWRTPLRHSTPFLLCRLLSAPLPSTTTPSLKTQPPADPPANPPAMRDPADPERTPYFDPPHPVTVFCGSGCGSDQVTVFWLKRWKGRFYPFHPPHTPEAQAGRMRAHDNPPQTLEKSLLGSATPSPTPCTLPISFTPTPPCTPCHLRVRD